MDYDYTPPLAHPSIGKYCFMLPSDVRFGSLDYQLSQSHHTLTYVRVLQYWAEKAQLLSPGQPHCLKPLVSFMEAEVFVATARSNWAEVSSPRLMEPTPQDPHHSHSQSHKAHPRLSMLAAHGEDQPTTTRKTDTPATPPWEMMLLQSDHKPLCPLPMFAGIAWALQGEESVESGPTLAIGIPPKEAAEPFKVMGSSVMVTQLVWHPSLGEVYINMLTCMLSIVAWGLTPWWMTTKP